MSASLTHVSDSLAAGSVDQSAGESVVNETMINDHRDEKVFNVEKERLVVEYVVECLFKNKRRKLAEDVDAEIQRALANGDKELDCGCGCSVPCLKKTMKKTKYTHKLAHQHWPVLEKELVLDISEAMLQSRRSNQWLSKELAQAVHENNVMRLKLAVVSSIF
jgi:hypothetical protein